MRGRSLLVLAAMLAAAGSVRLAAGEQSAAVTQVVAAGFFVTADGHFVSAVIGDLSGRQLLIEDADGVRVAARLLAVDPLDGLVLLKARGRFPTLVVSHGAPASETPLAPGAVVRFVDGRVASPGDGQPVTEVVGVDGVHLYVSAVPAGSLPGTPLLGADGEVVGMLRAVPAANDGDAGPAVVAIRAERLRAFLASEPGVGTELHAASPTAEAEEPSVSLGGAVARLSIAGPLDAALAEASDGASGFAASLHGLARQAAARHRLREAEHWWRLAAQRGSREAQAALAAVLLEDARASAARAEGLHWLQAAAVGGHAVAQAQLGAWYAAGGREPALARLWLEQAAQGGLPEGQRRFGLLLLDQALLPDEFVVAVDWLQRAAAQGDVAAQQTLVEIFREGRGPIEADPVEAAWWRGQLAESAGREPYPAQRRLPVFR